MKIDSKPLFNLIRVFNYTLREIYNKVWIQARLDGFPYREDFRLFENFPKFDFNSLKLEILFYFIKIQNLLSKLTLSS